MVCSLWLIACIADIRRCTLESRPFPSQTFLSFWTSATITHEGALRLPRPLNQHFKEARFAQRPFEKRRRTGGKKKFLLGSLIGSTRLNLRLSVVKRTGGKWGWFNGVQETEPKSTSVGRWRIERKEGKIPEGVDRVRYARRRPLRLIGRLLQLGTSCDALSDFWNSQ